MQIISNTKHAVADEDNVSVVKVLVWNNKTESY